MKNYTRESSDEMMQKLTNVMPCSEIIAEIERYFSSDDMGNCIAKIAQNWGIDLTGFAIDRNDLRLRIWKLSISVDGLTVENIRDEFATEELKCMLSDALIFNNENATKAAHEIIIEALKN